MVLQPFLLIDSGGEPVRAILHRDPVDFGLETELAWLCSHEDGGCDSEPGNAQRDGEFATGGGLLGKEVRVARSFPVRV